MILGFGSDIIDNRRIKKILEVYGKKFEMRCFTNKEIKKSNTVLQKSNYFAKKYAAKEACAKALGTGLSKGIYWKDIEVVNDKNGKPNIKLYNKALSRMKILTKSKFKIEISLSDEVNYSIANVIIFKNE